MRTYNTNDTEDKGHRDEEVDVLADAMAPNWRPRLPGGRRVFRLGYFDDPRRRSPSPPPFSSSSPDEKSSMIDDVSTTLATKGGTADRTGPPLWCLPQQSVEPLATVIERPIDAEQ